MQVDDHVEFKVLLYYTPLQKIPAGYSLATVSQAQQPRHHQSLAEACILAGVQEGEEVRLKNGLLQYTGEDPDKWQVVHTYRGFGMREDQLRYRLVSKPKSGEKLTEEDCLIALAHACEHDDVDDEVEELVNCAGKQILSTRMRFLEVGTVLHGCSWWGSINMLEKVLKDYPESVDVYITDKDGDTALHNLANLSDKYDTCKRIACLLLEFDGASKLLSVQNSYAQRTALCKALHWGKKEVCRALLDAGKEMEEKEAAETLEASKARDHWLTMRTQQDEESDTALDLAIFNEYEEIVELILAYPGAKELNLTRLQDQDGNTPLHNAAWIGNTEICSMLLKYCSDGASVTSKNKNDETPLHIASKHGHAEVCEKLLEYGASLDLADKDGRYALTNALSYKHNEAVKKLLDACLPRAKEAPTAPQPKENKDAPTTAPPKENKVSNTKPQRSLINAEFQFGITPLHAAVKISSEHHISNLLKAGALVEKRSDDGRTPLHVATTDKKFYKKHVLTTLLGKKLDSDQAKKNWINMKDKWGKTALHYILESLSTSSAVEGNGGNSAEGESNERGMEGNGGNIAEGESSKIQINNDENDEENTDEQNKNESIVGEICKMVEIFLKVGAWVDVQNCDGETSLHVAAQRHHKAVETLLTNAEDFNFESRAIDHKDKWISMCDFSGETALHEAVRSGSLEIVRHLLSKTESHSELIRVRDMENKTALAWAALKQNKKMIDEMMKKISDNTTKHFLMWNLKEHIDAPTHKQLCEKYKAKVDQTQLLQDAITNKDLDIAKELINKGANVTSLQNDELRWLDQNLGRKASDQPTLDDTLGRKDLVRGVATLLLNPYTQTPFTIGIFGRWGTGKSSFMLQVEEAMLYMAVKEAFRKTPYIPSHDKNSHVVKFSTFGVVLRYMVVKALKQCMGKTLKERNPNGGIENQETSKAPEKNTPNTNSENQDNKGSPNADIENQETSEAPKESSPNANINNQETFKAPQESGPNADIENQEISEASKESNPNANIENHDEEHDIINDFPMELQSKYHQLFKDLALTDRSKLVQSYKGAWYRRNVGMNNQTLQDARLIGYTPAVLTLHYNAWQYDNKTEASAGLAVEICRQLENSMTPHQWLRMCWKYSWNSRPKDIFVHLLLPAFLALAVVCVVLLLWKFVHIATKYKALSVPLGIVGVMWSFFKISLQVIQPVTLTMLNNTKSIDHRFMLGYQHQVIEDIKFLKEQLCQDAHFGWKILSFLCQLFISNTYFMEGTWIWKQHPRLNNFRIVMFIDDLDRCEENTILEILRAINLILGSSGINVVIGVDKDMVERAITKKFLKDTSDTEFMDEKEMLEENDQKVVEKVVDKKTIPNVKGSQKAKRNENIDNDDKDSYSRRLTNIYLQKIIQLPVQMPDPSKTNIEHFLEVQVGQHLSRLQKNKTNDFKQEFQKDKQKEKKKENLDLEGLQEIHEHHEDNSQCQHGIDNCASDSIVFHLILENYTPMEKDILNNLCKLATKERRFPREWKQFLNYHRLVWTILYQDPNMKNKQFKGWQIKLVLWIFLCWNWREQMDIIFEKWHDIK
eukprot:c25383_g1_i7 orf=2-4690(-)